MDLTQVQLAKKMGVAENSVHLVESDVRPFGDKGLLKLSMVLKKAGITGVTPSVLKLLCDQSNDPNVVKLQMLASELLDEQLAELSKK